MSLLYNPSLAFAADTSLVDKACLAAKYGRPLLTLALAPQSRVCLAQQNEPIAELRPWFADVMFLTQVSG